MRWILPLLSLAFVPAAFGELAVYTGTQSVQNASSTGRPTVVRMADVIDLSTGRMITIGLTGGRTDFSFVLGPEVEYVIAKTNDGKGHGATALAQAANGTDSAGSKFALATTLRGRDVKVTLSEAGPSQWPRTLVGTGSLVTSAGYDPAATPAGSSSSTLALTLSEPYSQLANSAGGTLAQVAEFLAPRYRNAVAASLKYTPVNTGVPAGASSAGLSKVGVGTLVLGSTSSVFNGALTVNGSLQVNVAALTLSNPVSSGTIGSSISGGATLELGGYQPISGSLVKSGPGLVVTGSIVDLGALPGFTRPPVTPVTSIAVSSGSLSLSGSGTLTLQNAPSYSGAVLTTGLNASNSLAFSATTTALTGRVLTGTDTYSGATTIFGGTLDLGSVSSIGSANNLTLTGAVLNGSTGLTPVSGGTLSIGVISGATTAFASLTGSPISAPSLTTFFQNGGTLIFRSQDAASIFMAKYPTLTFQTVDNGGNITVTATAAAPVETTPPAEGADATDTTGNT